MSAAKATAKPRRTGRKMTAPGPLAASQLEKLVEYAEIGATVADAAALLEIEEEALQRLVDDEESECARLWRKGGAEARMKVRKAQFKHLDRNATIAIHLGRELLGQTGNGHPPGRVVYLVDTGICRGGAVRYDA